MKATHLWGHFDGTKPCPRPKKAGKPTSAEVDAAKEWEYQDTVAGYLLGLRLPNTIVICLASCVTARDRWDAVTSQFQAKSAYAQADLHQSFLEMRCVKGEDI